MQSFLVLERAFRQQAEATEIQCEYVEKEAGLIDRLAGGESHSAARPGHGVPLKRLCSSSFAIAEAVQSTLVIRPASLDLDPEFQSTPCIEHALQFTARPLSDFLEHFAATADDDDFCPSRSAISPH